MLQASSRAEQSFGAPLQFPPLQVSPEVQASPSLQGCVLGRLTQPMLGSQLSLVQTFSSLHASCPAPGVQLPLVQTSPMLHALPSSQALPLLSRVQLAEQQSPSRLLPSSHCSPASSLPLPQAQLMAPTLTTGGGLIISKLGRAASVTLMVKSEARGTFPEYEQVTSGSGSGGAEKPDRLTSCALTTRAVASRGNKLMRVLTSLLHWARVPVESKLPAALL